MASSNSPALGTLERLPPELRNQIYKLAFSPGKLFPGHSAMCYHHDLRMHNKTYRESKHIWVEKRRPLARTCSEREALQLEISYYFTRKEIERRWSRENPSPFALLETSKLIRKEAYHFLDCAYSENYVVMPSKYSVEFWNFLTSTLRGGHPTIRKFEMSFDWSDLPEENNGFIRAELDRQEAMYVASRSSMPITSTTETRRQYREAVLRGSVDSSWISLEKSKWSVLGHRALSQLDDLVLDFRNSAPAGTTHFQAHVRRVGKGAVGGLGLMRWARLALPQGARPKRLHIITHKGKTRHAIHRALEYNSRRAGAVA